MQQPFKTVSLICLLAFSVTLLSACTTETEIKSANGKAPAITTLASDNSKGVQAAIKDDFAYPAEVPLLSRGKAVFKNNCAACHSAGNLKYDKIRGVRPVEQYLTLSRGDKGHKAFRNLSRQQRWETVFYYRFLSGGAAYTYGKENLQGVYGSNCAVCHGKGGQADGSLYTGHASRHELGMAPIKVDFVPPPANFADYPRFYNRTDDTLVKHISEGVYPSAMPPWAGRVDKAKQFVFDEKMIRELVFYVREFSYVNDLPAEEQIAGTGPVAGQWTNPSAEELRHDELQSAKSLKIGGGGVR